MDLNLQQVYEFIPKDDRDFCIKNRSHMKVLIIVENPMKCRIGTKSVRINSVYVAKMDDGVVTDFEVVDDKDRIEALKENWAFRELKHMVFDGYPCKIYYNS